MPSIAEILANPSYTPTELIAKLLRQRNGDAQAVVADLAGAGFKTTVNGVLRVGKKYGIIPKKTRVLKGRPTPKAYFTRYSKLMGGNIRIPGDVVRQKLAAQRKRRAAQIRPMFQGASSLEDLRSLMAGSWKKPRVARVSVPKRTKEEIREAQKAAFMRRFQSKYGMSPEMAGQVATQVGSPVRKRRYGVRRIGSMVAMNPSFANPAFDFSGRAILSNTVSGAQTAAGAIAGLAAAKYGNQFLIAPLAKNMLKQDDAGILGRLAAAFLSGTIVSTVARSFLPGDWGHKVADGAFAGAVMYVAGGIKMNDKPLLNIGALIQDSDGSLRDTALGNDVASQVRAAISAYTEAPRVADGYSDDMTGRGVGEYIIDPGPGAGVDREVF